MHKKNPKHTVVNYKNIDSLMKTTDLLNKCQDIWQQSFKFKLPSIMYFQAIFYILSPRVGGRGRKKQSKKYKELYMVEEKKKEISVWNTEK